MDFVFDEEQQELRATARAFLAENSGSAQIRNAMESELGFDAQLWKQLAELGWLSVTPTEKAGQAGAFFLHEIERQQAGDVKKLNQDFSVREAGEPDLDLKNGHHSRCPKRDFGVEKSAERQEETGHSDQGEEWRRVKTGLHLEEVRRDADPHRIEV